MSERDRLIWLVDELISMYEENIEVHGHDKARARAEALQTVREVREMNMDPPVAGVGRVRDYLDARASMEGLDPELIHMADSEQLLVSDLRFLINESLGIGGLIAYE